MKLKDLFENNLLIESVDFMPTKYNSEKGWHETPHRKVEKECNICDGTKIDYNDEPCRSCNQTGRMIDHEYDVPSMNVSNTNAMSIIELLGLPYEEDQGLTGMIPNKDLPELKRKLIRMKNTDNSKHVVEPREEQTKKQSYADTSGPVARIGTTGGMKIFHGGRSLEQIEGYINKLLEIIDTCQKNGYDLSWH